jgi:hypothetical protein
MKTNSFLTLISLVLISNFSINSAMAAETAAPASSAAPTPTPTGSPHANVPAALSAGVKVVSTMNSGGYTYVEYVEGGAKKWLAGPETKLTVGDSIEFTGAMPMSNFESKTLKRKFDSILFVSTLKVTNAEPANAVSEPIKVEKAAKGLTVEECFTKKASFKGKVISVRGKIVKLNENIMGKTWIHLQDGTGSAETKDLVVTAESAGDAKIGSVVTVTGKLGTDKDLGSGYFFAVILEEAKVDSKTKGKTKK